MTWACPTLYKGHTFLIQHPASQHCGLLPSLKGITRKAAPLCCPAPSLIRLNRRRHSRVLRGAGGDEKNGEQGMTCVMWCLAEM